METKRKVAIASEAVLILYWFAFLANADAYYSPYLLIGLLGVCCGTTRHIRKRGYIFSSRRKYRFTQLYAGLLSLTVTLANYRLYLGTEERTTGTLTCGMLAAAAIFAGGFLIFREILFGLNCWKGLPVKTACGKRSDRLLWPVLWAVIVAVDVFILFKAVYPGVLTSDSINQLEQIMGHSYSNHHPYYHTQIIHLWIGIGLQLFGNINQAVALYSVFSICVLALCFVYVTATVYRITGSRVAAVALWLWYLVMPFHIMYSMTMWKDVLFGAAVAGFVTAICRELRGIGNRKANTTVIIVTAFGVCLLRSNGWPVFLLSVLVFAVLFRKEHRRMLAALIVVLCASYVLMHPVLKVRNVSPTETIEALSVPAQQIARVIADGKPLTEGERVLLEEVVDVDRIPGAYNCGIADPVKDLVTEKGNQEYIAQHRQEFVKLYAALGVRYPLTYLKAWIDETRGYWNAGYSYWRWNTGVLDNGLGIERTVRSQKVMDSLQMYLHAWESRLLLQPFVSIGLYVWLLLLCLYKALVRGDSCAVYVVVPVLGVVASLLAATPVYTEFRYAYAVFCGLPLIAGTALYGCRSDGKAAEEENTSVSSAV